MKKILATLLIMLPLAAFSQSYQIPIDCGNESAMREMLKTYKEVPTFQMTTIRESVTTGRPMKIHTTLYVNFETKSWTLVEYFPGDKTYCIISSGEEIVPAKPATNGKPA
jgi:hypothetical protein